MIGVFIITIFLNTNKSDNVIDTIIYENVTNDEASDIYREFNFYETNEVISGYWEQYNK